MDFMLKNMMDLSEPCPGGEGPAPHHRRRDGVLSYEFFLPIALTISCLTHKSHFLRALVHQSILGINAMEEFLLKHDESYARRSGTWLPRTANGAICHDFLLKWLLSTAVIHRKSGHFNRNSQYSTAFCFEMATFSIKMGTE